MSSPAPALTPDRPVDELLVPVDTGLVEQRALPVATDLATRWQLPIRLVHVSPSISSVDPALAALTDEVVAANPELTVRQEHVYGDDPAVAIAGAATARSLIVMASDDADGWSFKESVGEAVAISAGVPVLLVGPDAALGSGPVMATTDGSGRSLTTVEPAVALAGGLGAGVRLVRVIPHPSDQHPDPKTDSVAELASIADDVRDRTDLVDVGSEVIRSNDPVGAITEAAAIGEASVIVAALRGRTDETRTSMCSITMGTVGAASCPVLVVAAGSGS